VTEAAAPLGPYVDLHAHTTASDGRATPAELIAVAVAADLQAIAITDHDTIAGLAAGQCAADAAGIHLVRGIELSTIDGHREIHLLGLHLQTTDTLERTLVSVQEARVGRAEQIVAKLNKLQIPVTIDMVLAQANGGSVGRPHIARAMVAGGWVRDLRDAFDKYLGDGKAASVGKLRLELREGIQLIHEAGGVAIWAHPQADATRDRVAQFAARGLDGVEVRHPSHNADDVARISTLCEHFDLLKSGGSDWHGATDGFRPVGCMHVPAPWMDEQLARAARWRVAMA
jgi:3',5'-nucleoside bisphosphate phosphatase